MGESGDVYRILVGKPEGKRLLGRPKHRWQDNIKMDLQEVRCEGMDWIDLAEDRDRWRALVNTVMNLATLPLGKSQKCSTEQEAGWFLELV
jgi:hypothetical protein